MGVLLKDVQTATVSTSGSDLEERLTIEYHDDNKIGLMWQPVCGGLAALLIMVIVVGLAIMAYRKRKRKNDEKSYPTKGTDLWIPPTQSHKNFVNLSCVTPHTDADNDSSDNSIRKHMPLDPPINLTSGSLVQLPVQPTGHGAIERKHSTHQRQRHSSYSSGSPLESSSKASDDEDNDDVPNTSGKIWFKCKYSPGHETLAVEVIKAKYLRGRCIFYSPRDPFVRVYLLPDETNYFQTKVKYRTFSPKYKETFLFKLDLDNAACRSLKFVIYDFDKNRVRHSLGQVTVPLAHIDIMSEDATCKELDDSPHQRAVYIGEILLSLFCNPFTDKLKVTVIRLRNLPTRGINKPTDVFVRADLHHGRHLAKTKISLMHPMDTNVEFQETFAFGVCGKYLDSCNVAITVVCRTRGTAITAAKKEETPIGRMVVGPFMFARGRGLLHWQEMLSNTRTEVEKWHNLCEVT